jgi:hypothetical protein
MNRRIFLKLTGLVAVGQTLWHLPVAAAADLGLRTVEPDRASSPTIAPPATSLTIDTAGTYRISGLVRVEAPLVEISGITDKQSISWANADGSEPPLASFVAFERYERAGMATDIQVQGGRIESLAAVLLD